MTYLYAFYIFLSLIGIYLVLVVVSFLFVEFIAKEKYKPFEIRKATWTRKQLVFEIKETAKSYGSILLLCMIGAFGYEQGWVKFYYDVGDLGWAYFCLSLFLMLLAHDAYFFFTHIIMHKVPFLYRFHLIHHKSHNPNYISSYSTHFVEGFVNFGFFLLIMMVMPINIWALILFYSFLTFCSASGHGGLEFYPNFFDKIPLARDFNSSVHHNMHHQYFHCNYGLYFTWWDDLFGTNHPDYKERFKAIKLQRDNALKGAPRGAIINRPTLNP